MTDPTPTPQAPPQGLTDAQLLELAEKELCIDDMQDAHEEHYPIEVVTDGLIAAMRAAIAAHEAARVGLHCYLDDDGLCPSPCVFDDPTEQISDCTYAQGLQRDGEPKTSCPYYRTTPTPQAPPQGLTDEQLDAAIDQAYKDSRRLMVAQSGLASLDRFVARAAIAAHEAARPQLTPEEVAARFRAWWAQSFPNAPAGPHAVASHVTFALHLLGGEVQ